MPPRDRDTPWKHREQRVAGHRSASSFSLLVLGEKNTHLGRGVGLSIWPPLAEKEEPANLWWFRRLFGACLS